MHEKIYKFHTLLRIILRHLPCDHSQQLTAQMLLDSTNNNWTLFVDTIAQYCSQLGESLTPNPNDSIDHRSKYLIMSKEETKKKPTTSLGALRNCKCAIMRFSHYSFIFCLSLQSIRQFQIKQTKLYFFRHMQTDT